MSSIGFLVGDGFEERELRRPYDEFASRGHRLTLIGLTAGSMVHGKHAHEQVTIEEAARAASIAKYDALVIPGGDSPGHLRRNAGVISFVGAMVEGGKLIAAICHGPQLLIAAGAARGKTLTSWPSIKDELIAAGATWVDRDVVIDGRLITSREPADLAAFTHALEVQLALRHELPAGPHPRELAGPRG
jgi:protease I